VQGQSKAWPEPQTKLDELVADFKKANTSDLPDFYSLSGVLEQGLWILYVAKERLNTERLNRGQIEEVARVAMEVSIEDSSLLQAFRRAGNMLHATQVGIFTYYEIMRAGKEHLLKSGMTDKVSVFYFEPGKKFSSKRTLSQQIIQDLRGQIKVVDPYPGVRTLDIMRGVADRPVRFLTRIENLKHSEKEVFLRELKDFAGEHTTIEFRSYPNEDMHDRYIISKANLVLLGHSIKDLGGKESFAIVLSADASRNVASALTEAFDRRWKASNPIP
jgi:hypothetical protein